MTSRMMSAWWGWIMNCRANIAGRRKAENRTATGASGKRMYFTGRGRAFSSRVREALTALVLTLIFYKFHDPRFFGPFALVFVEDSLAQPKVLRRRFHKFVHVNVFQGAFQAQLERRRELDAFAFAL